MQRVGKFEVSVHMQTAAISEKVTLADDPELPVYGQRFLGHQRDLTEQEGQIALAAQVAGAPAGRADLVHL